MQREIMVPRADWREKCDAVGFTFYDMESEGGRPYWNESAAYSFSTDEIEELHDVTQELVYRTFDAAEHIVRKKRFEEFAIPESFWHAVTESWDNDDPTVYGRFDLAWDGTGDPKMLEYNADTPTSLVESAAAQWFWMREVIGQNGDQFNSIHEALVEQWSHIRTERWHLPFGSRLHVASLRGNEPGTVIMEDFDTVAYMAEPAQAAGFAPKHVFIEDIGWDEQQQMFVDQDGEQISHIFKLYPLEWMVHESFGPKLLETKQPTKWVEPLWKLLLSNKQLLVVMHELFPKHPNILAAYNAPTHFSDAAYVQKPKLSREGANVVLYGPSGEVLEASDGDYGEEGYVYQAIARLGQFGTKHAVIGSWVVGETPVGIDIRETSSLITGDLAEFVPHYITK